MDARASSFTTKGGSNTAAVGLAAGIAGLAVGAAIASSANNDNYPH